MEMEVIKMIDWMHRVRFMCHRHSAPRMEIHSHKHEFRWLSMRRVLRDTHLKWSLFGGGENSVQLAACCVVHLCVYPSCCFHFLC